MAKKATIGSLVAVVALGCGLVIGEEPVSVDKPTAEPETPVPAPVVPEKVAVKDLWLGIYVSKPAPAVHAQLKEVPQGVGFVVDRVAVGSPAEVAGLRKYDFVWMMNDQLLVNSSQFWTLLNLEEEGDQVSLTIQRGGENQEVDLSVEQRPEDQKGRERADSRVMSPPIPGMPRQMHDLLGRVAELRDDKGSVRIWRRDEGFGWTEYDEFDLEMHSGRLTSGGEEAFVPNMDARLKGKLQALIRGYEQAERNHQANGRTPRIRRVPEDANRRHKGASDPE